MLDEVVYSLGSAAEVVTQLTICQTIAVTSAAHIFVIVTPRLSGGTKCHMAGGLSLKRTEQCGESNLRC